MASSSPALARCRVRDGIVLPQWFTERDHPWIRDLIETYTTFVGAPRQVLDERLARSSDGPCSTPGWRIAAHVLDKLFQSEIVSAAEPRVVRAVVFRTSATRPPREEALARAAEELGISIESVESSMLADLPGERRIRPPDEPVHASTVALRCNLAIAQAALKHSSHVAITLEGHARAVVRHAKLRGLICTVSRSSKDDRVVLEVSGPLALFRSTALYGRHLAELVPILSWARSFRLEAQCELRHGAGRLTLGPADPIPPSQSPRLYDSLLEQRFARDFTRATRDWELVREPEPVAVDDTLIFPDFAMTHTRNAKRRWLLEIAGFWTTGYIEQKLRRLRACGLTNLILCVDSSRDCGQSRLLPNCPVIRFRKRIDVTEVLAVIETQRPEFESRPGPTPDGTANRVPSSRRTFGTEHDG
ncbi:MAG: DUF790 family protein [bacterium]|nr:DUF790 family protein [bacterium]